MRIAVLGAGVIGLTTAHYLTQRGHEIVLVEHSAHAASGASFANGGQLSYSYADALARPSLLCKIPKLLLGTDPAIRIKGGPQASLFTWGAQLLAQCTSRKAIRNTQQAMSITAESKQRFEQLQRDLQLNCANQQVGKLILYSSTDEFAKAQASCQFKQEQGFDVRAVSLDEAIELEPSIQFMPADYCGAIWSKDDEVADCHQFCEELNNVLKKSSLAELRYQTTINALHAKHGALTSIETNHGSINVDRAVVCTGARSKQLLEHVGVSIPVYPVRGYSVSLPKTSQSPVASITDAKHRIVFSQLEEHLRIAGFADFVGFDHSGDAERQQHLLEIARKVAPKAANYSVDDIKQWGGFRPMTPTGLPIVGATSVRGLYTNTGHGMLGWTMACASAYKIAELISST